MVVPVPLAAALVSANLALVSASRVVPVLLQLVSVKIVVQ
jgi:hypothetical protein